MDYFNQKFNELLIEMISSINKECETDGKLKIYLDKILKKSLQVTGQENVRFVDFKRREKR